MHAPALSDATLTPRRSLREAIESVAGSAVFVDLSYPKAAICGTSVLGGILALRLPCAKLEHDFLCRFRQAGGHVPIATVDFSKRDFSWPAEISQWSGTFVAAFDSFEAAASASDRLREIGIGPAISAATKRSNAAVKAAREFA